MRFHSSLAAQHVADRAMDDGARPLPARRELLQDVQLALARPRRRLPAAPAAVVLVVISAQALPELLVPRFRPREVVGELGHVALRGTSVPPVATLADGSDIAGAHPAKSLAHRAPTAG